MTACSWALVGNLAAWGFWVAFFGGLLVLWRRTVVVRRGGDHAAAMEALRRRQRAGESYDRRVIPPRRWS